MRRLIRRISGDHSLAPIHKFYRHQEAVVSAGAFTITHNFGRKPVLFQLSLLVNNSALGYSPGDEVVLTHMDTAGVSGVSLIITATTVVGRFSSAANPFTVIRADTGASGSFTTTQADLIVRMWA